MAASILWRRGRRSHTLLAKARKLLRPRRLLVIPPGGVPPPSNPDRIGTASGTAAVLATGIAIVAAVATATGSASANSIAANISPAVASATGTATVNGFVTFAPVTGTASGSASVSATGRAIKSSVATALGSAAGGPNDAFQDDAFQASGFQFEGSVRATGFAFSGSAGTATGSANVDGRAISAAVGTATGTGSVDGAAVQRPLETFLASRRFHREHGRVRPLRPRPRSHTRYRVSQKGVAQTFQAAVGTAAGAATGLAVAPGVQAGVGTATGVGTASASAHSSSGVAQLSRRLGRRHRRLAPIKRVQPRNLRSRGVVLYVDPTDVRGQANGDAVGAATGRAIVARIGTASGSGTASAVGARTIASIATASGSATASATGLQGSAAITTGSATVAAVSARTIAGVGTATGGATVNGNVIVAGLVVTVVQGSLFNENGVKLTQGELRIKARSMISDNGQLVAPTTIIVPIPSSGDISFTIVPSYGVFYDVVYDPDPTDAATPLQFKAGYFTDTWLVPATGTVDISTL